jgi:hypothetical protein
MKGEHRNISLIELRRRLFFEVACMTTNFISVPVTLVTNSEVAKIIAMSELEGIYSSNGAEMKLQKLEADGITVESLAQYFMDCATIQCAFVQQKRSMSSLALKNLGFRFSEPKNLYLPVLMATILSQIGDVVVSKAYHIEVCVAADAKVDRDSVIAMSEALYRNAGILQSAKDQIGVANREVQSDVMSTIVLTMDDVTHVAKTGSMVTAENVDSRCRFLATCAGLTLVNTALSVLYPFEDYICCVRPRSVVSPESKQDSGPQS